MSDLTVDLKHKLVKPLETQLDLDPKENPKHTAQAKITISGDKISNKSTSPIPPANLLPNNLQIKPTNQTKVTSIPKVESHTVDNPKASQKFSALTFAKIERSARTIREASKLEKEESQKPVLSSYSNPSPSTSVHQIPRKPTSFIRRFTHTLLYGGKDIIEILLEPLISLLSSKKLARRRALLQVLAIKKQSYSDKKQQVKNLKLGKSTKNFNSNNILGTQDLKFEETEEVADKVVADKVIDEVDASAELGIKKLNDIIPYYNQLNNVHFDDSNAADSLNLLIMPIISPIRKKLRKKLRSKGRKKKIIRD